MSLSHELRWNPLLATWTIVASNRQKRPNLETTACPFCPGSEKVPDNYRVHVYPNDFPALKLDDFEEVKTPHITERSAKQPPVGHCEVILYSPDHHARLYDLDDDHVLELVETWKARHIALAADPRIKYIFPFENRGEEVGVTMLHPHGQLYGYGFVPLKIQRELEQCRRYHKETGQNLMDDIRADEQAHQDRLVAEDEHFAAFIPEYCEYPYGIHIVAKHEITSLSQLDEASSKSLALHLKTLVRAFDDLFDRPFPYMMCVHQAPVNSRHYPKAHEYYRFHIEFYPPLRSSTAIKWNASSETGAWAAANTVDVDQAAQQLRDVYQSPFS